MLEGYFDESGKLQDQPIVAVAGYVSTPNKWEMFAREWKRVLDRYGVRAFHMTDCESQHGEFKGWEKERSVQLMSELIPIILKHTIFGIGAAMTTQDYKALTAGRSSNCHPYVRDPYYGCMYYCFNVLVDQMNTRFSPKKKAALLFDRVKGMHGQAVKVFNRFKDRSSFGYRLARINFGSACDDIPLQAADLLAFETRKLVGTYTCDATHRRRSAQRLFSTRNYYGGFLDRPKLDKLVSLLRERDEF